MVDLYFSWFVSLSHSTGQGFKGGVDNGGVPDCNTTYAIHTHTLTLTLTLTHTHTYTHSHIHTHTHTHTNPVTAHMHVVNVPNDNQKQA